MTEQTEYTYDLFVSYADADRPWVEGYLLDALTQAGVRFHSEAAFALGVPRLLEFERAVQESRRTLLVLSPATLADGFNQFTDLLAQSYGLETATWPVIPLILQPVELPPRLAMLTALDATHPAEWPAVVERLCAELQRPVPGPASRPPCPYPGMVPFSEADSDRFFGRDQEVQELLERLRLHPFLTVIGPSGSGKSSLVFAGLVPALRKSGLFGPGGWLVRTLRPGVSPLAALVAALDGTPAAVRSNDFSRSGSEATEVATTNKRLLLVADQFEELFTLSRSDVEPFQQSLLRLAEMPNCTVVLTVRADFYPDLMACPLWREIQAHRFEVLPLDEDELRQAVVRPAEGVGVFVETALVERLVADAGREPGVLPLVQETLVLLWERVERRFLPLRAYEALVLPRAAYGVPERTGLQVAMARRADAALTGLTPEQQAIARRIFLRLVQFGEGRADTRRQQPVTALRVVGEDLEVFDRTLEHLADSRLLTLSGEEEGVVRRVDIAHESLIAGWPTLQEWLAQRREAELTRRRLEDKAQEWVRLGRGEGGMLDEVELLEAERWLESPDAADLGYGEALPALVDASRSAQEEAAVQRRQAARFRLGALGAIAALVIVALGIGLWSARQNAVNLEAIADREGQLAQQQQHAAATAQAVAVEQQNLAATAEAGRDQAERQTRLATVRQLAAQVQVALEAYPQRSLLLAIEALNVTTRVGEPRVPAAEDALRQALANSGGRGLSGHENWVTTMAISSDGRWLATGSDDHTARLWDLTAPDPAATSIVLHGHDWWVNAVAISPDNRWLATGSGDGTARLWDLTAPDPAAAPVVLRGHEEDVETVVISPDGRWLATGSRDNTARLWDLTAPDPAAAPIVLRGHEEEIAAVAISPDNHWLVTGSGDGTARLWDLTASDPAAAPVVVCEHEAVVEAVAVSPDNHWLVTAGLGGTVRLWDLTAPDPAATPILMRGHDGWVRAVAISPDNRWLATGSEDHTARLWDLTAPDPAAASVVLHGHEEDVEALAFSPDGHWLATGSEDHTVRLWDLTAPDPAAAPIVLHGHDGDVKAVAISPDNRWLVTGSDDYTAHLWDLTAPDPAATPIVLRGHRSSVEAVAISSDDHWLVTGGWDDAARLWDLTAPDPAAAPIVLRGHEENVTAVAFSPDNRWLATASGAPFGDAGDDTARLWDLTAPDPSAASIVLRGHGEEITALAFSPDNRWLATASGDSTARLWDVTAPDPAAAPIVLRGHELVVNAVAFSPDNHWLATGSNDETVRLWDLTAPDPAAVPIVLRGHEDFVRAVAISSDSHWLATGGNDKTARLWDLTASNPDAASTALRGHEDTILALAMSPDSRWLVTGGGDLLSDAGDNAARLWDLTAPDPAAASVVLRGHEDWINALAISSDGHWLVTGSRDGTARLWNLRLDELVDLACRTAGRNLTREEWNQYLPGQAYRKTCEQWSLEGE